MTPTRFGHDNPTPNYRSQPIWVCDTCSTWEPGDLWADPLPEGWNGQHWDSGGVQ